MASAFPIAQSFEGFRRLPPAQKMGLATAVAALASLVAAWWMWSQSPDYQVLYSNLSDRDGGAVVAALAQMNVPYKVADTGGAILVPGAQVHDARLKLASQGLPKGSIVGFELLDGQKLGATQFQEQVAYQRGLEGELARSIQALSAVKAARVHLAIPRATSFLRDQQKPTASVLVNLHPGRSLDRAHVAGIVHLVASSVPELNTRGVSVVDQNGTLLSSSPAEGAALDATQLAYVREIESALARRIEEIIEPIVGAGNVRAQITADVDFSTVESTAETFKPNQAEPAIRAQTVSEKSASGTTIATGVPGAASNAPNAQPQAPDKAGKEGVLKDSSTTYEIDRVVKRERRPTGNVKRLSAAVVVNHSSKTNEDGEVTREALPKEAIEQIQALAREAMGFTEARGDSLNVSQAAFAQPAPVTPVETPFWKDPAMVSTLKDSAKAVGAALLVLYLVFGVLRPLLRSLAAAAPRVEALPGGQDLLESPEKLAGAGAAGNDSIQNVRQLAKQDPKMVANVVKTWVSGGE